MSGLLESKNQEVYYFNILNIISCFGVVMFHVNDVIWKHPVGTLTGSLWITSNIIYSAMYFPVPIFFMLSGANLLDYRNRYSTKEYLKKRFVKTVIPFLIWSCLACAFMMYLSEVKNIPFNYSYRAILDGILNTKYNTAYWFFIALFSVYLSMPIISLIPKNRSIYIYILLYGFITYSLLPTVFKLVNINYNEAIKAPAIGGYLLYVFLGYFLKNLEIPKNYRKIIYLFSIVGFSFLFFGTLLLSSENKPINEIFRRYLNFPGVLYSVGVFVFFKYSNYTKLKTIIAKTTISTISKYSFGVYLIHMFYILIFEAFFQVNIRSIVWRIGGTFLIYLLSLGTAVLIKKIPLVEKIIP